MDLNSILSQSPTERASTEISETWQTFGTMGAGTDLACAVCEAFAPAANLSPCGGIEYVCPLCRNAWEDMQL